MIGGLTEAERALADCAGKGELCRISGIDSPVPTQIRPAVLAALLSGRLEIDGDVWVTHPCGVMLSGGSIAGDLSLAFVTESRPLTLVDCTLGALDVTAAVIPRLVLTRCTLDGIRADAATIAVGMTAESCRVRGMVTMSDATVSTVSLRGTEILAGADAPVPRDGHRGAGPPAGFALDARRLHAVGDVLLNPDPESGRGFLAHGPVTFVDAHIGHFGAFGASILGVDEHGNSLVAERLQATGSVHLAEGLTTSGAVRMVGAKIGNRLSVCPARIGANLAGEALVADDLDVGGRVDISDGVPDGPGPSPRIAIAGRVGFADARMRGLRVAGTRILPAGGPADALIADRVVVQGDVVLGPGTEIGGAVHLDGARVDGIITCRDVTLGVNDQRESFSADHITVSGHVQFDSGTVAAGALRLLSAHINGQLRLLSACTFGPNNHGSALFADDLHCEGPVELSGRDDAQVEVRGAVQLARAQLGGLRCTGGSIGGTAEQPGSLSIERSVIKGDVSLTGHVVVGGTIRLRGAEIRGRLSLQGTRIDGQDEQGNAIVADAASITGDVLLDADAQFPFTAAGAVRLRSATIGGSLSLRGASIRGADTAGYAIVASYLKITGAFRATSAGTHQLDVAGAIRLADSRLGGLHISGGSIRGHDDRGYALAAHAIQVASQVTLGPHLTLAGATSLFGAGMNQLRCSHVRLAPSSRPAALTLDNATVRGNVECAEGFVADGPVQMFGLTVGGRLVLDGAEIRGEKRGETEVSLAADALEVARDVSMLGLRTAGRVSLRSARVGGTLHVTYAGIGSRLSLASARVSVLRDHLTAGDQNGQAAEVMPEIDLVGLHYDHISRGSEMNVRHRLKWLGMLPGNRFHSQPHEHLASVYRSQGDAASARLVAIDKHQRRTRDLRRWRLQRLPRQILYITVGHGYRPWLAGIWAIIVIGGFAAAVDRADATHVMIQNRPLIAETQPQASPTPSTAPVPVTIRPSSYARHECDPQWPCLNALGYAADAFFPGVSLDQETTWRPNTATGYGWWLRSAQWVVAALGWILATIFVAAVAGIVRSQ